MKLTQAVLDVPRKIKDILANTNKINDLTKHLNNYSVIYSKGISYPIALEGSLKMKEIIFIRTCSYPSGELETWS